MLIVGENPALSFPKPSLVKKALASLDFLVVTDMFLTETAKLATVVLPASSFAEKEGSFTNLEGRVQKIRKAIEPVGSSLPDWQIILRLAGKLGCPMPYLTPQQVWEEIEQMVPLYQCLEYADLEAEESSLADPDNQHLGVRRLYRGPFPSGFMRFCPVEYVPPATVTGDGYPLTLLSGSILNHFGSGTRSFRASRLKRFAPRSWVEVSPVDAKNLGISAESAVKIVSPEGEVATIARITDALPSGLLFMPLPFPESNANELFGDALDPRAKTPALKACAVRLERMSTDG